jgi:hypothetical protein
MACPGSVALLRRVPRSGSSKYAEEGTAAHELGEECIRGKKDPAELLGESWTDAEGVQHEIDQEMVDAVSTYVLHVRELIQQSVWYSIERQFFLDSLNPPAPMYGTADFVCIAGDILHVVDYKHGKGVAVEVPENKQLLYYALGAYVSVPQEMLPRIQRVQIAIVQPRAFHKDGPVRTWKTDVMSLVDYATDLFGMADIALAPGAPLAIGDHCRWCDVKGVCPEASRQAVTIAQGEFKVLQDKPTSPEPTLLTTAQLADFLPKFDQVEAWMKGVREHAYNLLLRGEAVPGYKLVDKRATRKWANEDEVEKWIATAGHDSGKLHATKLLTPAQAEKALGKKHTIPADLISKVSSGYTMTEATDARPAANIIAAADEFAAVDATSIL